MPTKKERAKMQQVLNTIEAPPWAGAKTKWLAYHIGHENGFKAGYERAKQEFERPVVDRVRLEALRNICQAVEGMTKAMLSYDKNL